MTAPVKLVRGLSVALLACLATATTLAPPASASAADDQAYIMKNLADPVAAQNVYNSAKHTLVMENNPCPGAKYALQGEPMILLPIKFDAAGKPTAGQFVQRVAMLGCGTTRTLNVFVDMAKRGMAPVLPGTTHADPILQGDTLRYAFAAAGNAVSPSCKRLYVMNTEFLQDEGTATSAGTPWREAWTLSLCQKRAVVIVHYVPDKTGTQIITKPAETKFVPAK